MPVEYSQKNKVDNGLKFRLACQVLVKNLPEKLMPKFGQIIFGERYAKTKFRLKKYLNEAKTIRAEILKIQNEKHVPKFKLNFHCRTCRYEDHCHAKAVQSDDLSLMSGLSKKEIGKLNKRGIFTITQLGHSFSPQRRRMKTIVKHLYALKALAIKDQKIYVNQPPNVPDTKIQLFLDVEGLPDKQEYYLIDLKVRSKSS